VACNEIAALRVGLMNVTGQRDEAELQHELAELGNAAETPGPLRDLTQAGSLADLRTHFEAAVTELAERVAAMAPEDPRLGYYRTLIVTTKKVELDLRRQVELLAAFSLDLEEMHDFIHEIYPAD